jgi:hypothetical protein
MSIKKRLEKLESQNGNKAETPTIKPHPEISPEAWMALFTDSDIGMTMTCEQMAEWAAQNGY